MRQISVGELAQWLAAAGRGERAAPLLLDVREPWELEICGLDGALPIPLASVPQRLPELDPAAEIVVVCHHGVRSLQVALFLEGNGFATVYNLSGGVAAWAIDVDPSMQKY